MASGLRAALQEREESLQALRETQKEMENDMQALSDTNMDLVGKNDAVSKELEDEQQRRAEAEEAHQEAARQQEEQETSLAACENRCALLEEAEREATSPKVLPFRRCTRHWPNSFSTLSTSFSLLSDRTSGLIVFCPSLLMLKTLRTYDHLRLAAIFVAAFWCSWEGPVSDDGTGGSLSSDLCTSQNPSMQKKTASPGCPCRKTTSQALVTCNSATRVRS